MELKTRLSRPPLARMLGIHEILQQGRKTNRRTLSESLEVSAKTVQRDIDFMRDQLGLPIDYDETSHSYFYARKVVQFPTMQISEGELVALTVAKKALSQYQGTSFEKPLRDAFEKLTASLRDQIRFAWNEDGGPFSFRSAGQSVGDLGVFEAVSQSVLTREEIEFEYRKIETDHVESRAVQPLHLACIDQQWYLFGYDLGRRGEVRTFALTRMSKLHRTGRFFENHAPFSLDEHLAGSFGVYASASPERIVLRFDEIGGRLVRERVWHASQQIEPLPKGGLQLSLEVGISPEIERWILGWGDHVEVFAPAGLRENIARKSARVAAFYRDAAEEKSPILRR